MQNKDWNIIKLADKQALVSHAKKYQTKPIPINPHSIRVLVA
jgi:hypothetical protein